MKSQAVDCFDWKKYLNPQSKLRMERGILMSGKNVQYFNTKKNPKH